MKFPFSKCNSWHAPTFFPFFMRCSDMREGVSNHDAGKSHVRMWEVDTVFESHCHKM